MTACLDASGRRVELITLFTTTEVNTDGGVLRVLKDVLNLIPPKPQRSVDKATHEKHGQRAIKTLKNGSRNLSMVEIPVVYRKTHSPAKRSALLHPHEDFAQGEELVAFSSELGKYRANSGGIMTVDVALGAGEPVEHENRDVGAAEKRQRLRDPRYT